MSDSNKVWLALVIHSHQPVGNFDHVFEEAYRKSYLAFVRTLLDHSSIRLTLHYSGILLEWLEARHPEFFDELRRLVDRGQAELMTGGYYEPILPAIPDPDKLTQIEKLSQFVRTRFGVTPAGAWVAERVWEPGLARPLAEAGVKYIVLDDTHFLAAGLEPSELRGTYVTEEMGRPLTLVPSLKALRYAIPFREPEESLRILSEGRGQPAALFAMGDDCEKFGVWPGTYDHCYKAGWLERFFKALEDSSEWLATTTVSDFLASHPPLGRVYLPTASYEEMMEWALPAPAASEFKTCQGEAERMPAPAGERFRRFLRGGLWRNFLSKYSEANQIQKLVLRVSRRWQAAQPATLRLNAQGGERSRTAAGRHDRPEDAHLLDEARTHLLAAQCNDTYWHGVFGGLYAPHLRSAVLGHLIDAERLLDTLTHPSTTLPTQAGSSARTPNVLEDFDADGQVEILIEREMCAMVVRPAEGGTVSSLRFKPASPRARGTGPATPRGVELINSLMRRPEAYHELIRRRAASVSEAPRGGLPSIHERVVSKESNLDALLRYDRYARSSFRTYLFPALKQWEDFEQLRLGENETFAKGAWELAQEPDATGPIELTKTARVSAESGDISIEARKTFSSKVANGGWRLECRSSLSTDRPCPASLALGLELVFNLLAPNAPDRYFLAAEVRRPLEFAGEILAPRLSLVDEWQRVKISLSGEPEPRWWIAPIETVSQSETGFERVYQGSAILAVWEIESPAWRNTSSILRCEVDVL